MNKHHKKAWRDILNFVSCDDSVRRRGEAQGTVSIRVAITKRSLPCSQRPGLWALFWAIHVWHFVTAQFHFKPKLEARPRLLSEHPLHANAERVCFLNVTLSHTVVRRGLQELSKALQTYETLLYKSHRFAYSQTNLTSNTGRKKKQLITGFKLLP